MVATKTALCESCRPIPNDSQRAIVMLVATVLLKNAFQSSDQTLQLCSVLGLASLQVTRDITNNIDDSEFVVTDNVFA